MSRFLTSTATSSANSCTTGLFVVSLAIVGRKDTSFETQLDFEVRFSRLLSLDLKNEFFWSAS